MTNLILWNSFNSEDSATRTLGCYQLASWVRQNGYSVKVIDFCSHMSTDDLVNITSMYISSNTLAIGISTTFWKPVASRAENDYEPQWVIDARIRLNAKHICWLLGGTAVIFHETFKFPWIRFTGLSEDSLLTWLDQNSRKLVKRNAFEITTSTLLFTENDYIQPHEVLPMELARGCQFTCKFCSYPLIGKKKGTYIRDYDLIKEIIIRNYAEYGVTKYYFLDDTVNESEEKIYALANIAQSLPFRLEWVGYNRADIIWSKPGMVSALKDSGLRSAFFGIESFGKEASIAIGKAWSGTHAKEFLSGLRDQWKDITFSLNFIAGLPGDTPDDLISTVQWCIDNRMYRWHIAPLYINSHPNRVWHSAFDNEYEKYGYSMEDTYLWTNNNWTYGSAIEFSSKMNEESACYMVNTGFILASHVSLGYSFDELLYTPEIGPMTAIFKDKTTRFVNSYVTNHLNMYNKS